MNNTTKAIIDRLPNRPMISPGDIAAAYGLASTNAILADIKLGHLAANCLNGKYIISRSAAEEYIAANEYTPNEGTIEK